MEIYICYHNRTLLNNIDEVVQNLNLIIDIKSAKLNVILSNSFGLWNNQMSKY